MMKSKLILIAFVISIFFWLYPKQVMAVSTITVPEDYSTIQKAIEASTPGDILFVHSGAYHENIIIDQPISLIGESKESTVIVGSRMGDVVYISSDKVKVSGFTIEDSGTEYISPFEGGDAGIKLDGVTNTNLSNLIVTKNSIGIFLNSSNDNILEKNTVYSNSKDGIYLRLSNNNIIRANTADSNGGHGGIYLNPASSNNLIEDNVCNSNPDHGIKLQTNSNDNIVRNNTCLYNGDGVFLLNAYRNKITDNNCSSNDRPGIFLRLSENNVVANNTCKFNTDHGISLDFLNFNNTIENNACSNNEGAGITLRLSSNYNRVINNVCTLNEQQGVKIEYSDYNEIFYNSLLMNRGGGILVEPRQFDQWNEFMGRYKEDVEAKIARGIKVESSENSTENKIKWNKMEGEVYRNYVYLIIILIVLLAIVFAVVYLGYKRFRK